MSFVGRFVLLVGALVGIVFANIPGGWQVQDHTKDEYLGLAHLATSQAVEGRQHYDTVLELLKAETQVVAGTNYRLSMKVAESICKIGEDTYTKEQCTAKPGATPRTCTAVLLQGLREPTARVTSFECS